MRPESSPHEAKSQESASLTAPQIPSAGARTGVLNSTWGAFAAIPRRSHKFALPLETPRVPGYKPSQTFADMRRGSRMCAKLM